MKGLRVAVFGAGRSGIAAAEAALRAGGVPTVFEEGPTGRNGVQEASKRLSSLGVGFAPGWTGEFKDAGCDLVVTSPGVDRRHPKLQKAVADGIEVISEIELAYRISQAPIVAITGTNGKSTTTVMTWLCLKATGAHAVLCGNVYGSGYDEIALTEAASQSTPDQILVAEVSSFQLEWVRDFKPVSAGITNVAPDHLNRYEDFAEYAATKQRVFARQTAEDRAVIRFGDPVVAVPLGPQVRTFGEADSKVVSGSNPDAMVSAEAIRIGERTIPIAGLNIVAAHDRMNAAMALLLAQGALHADGCQGIVELAEGLKEFKGLLHRMERIGERGGVAVYNNSMCTNPRAVESSSKGLPGRRQHLLIGGVNKDLGFADLAVYLREAGHRVYVFGRDGRQIARELTALDQRDIVVSPTMEEAFAEAVVRAKAGEAIILSPGCASFDQFEDFRQRGDVFRKLAKEWLGI